MWRKNRCTVHVAGCQKSFNSVYFNSTEIRRYQQYVYGIHSIPEKQKKCENMKGLLWKY